MKTVKFCGFFDLQYKSFYLIVNVLDIWIFASIIAILFRLNSNPNIQVLVSAGVFVSLLSLAIAIVALALFVIENRNFSPILHQFYNWIRATAHIIYIFMGAYLIFYISLFKNDRLVLEMNRQKLFTILSLLLGLSFLVLNITWSVKLKKILIEIEDEQELKANGINSDLPSNIESN